MSEQQANLTRVYDNIADVIMDFCRTHVGQTFTSARLRAFVTSRMPVAPASPDRILRELRKRGEVSYVVVSRAQSLYRVLSVREAA